MAQNDASQSLKDRLADVLPADVPFNIYHISTPPTTCPALYSAAPGTQLQKTYCESHFLAVAIRSDDQGLFILAVEVLVYITAQLTTLFVSKADSTGYFHLLRSARSDVSPIRAITSTFIHWLVQCRQRPGIRLVVSLFARAQDQYLFPGSIENATKHVLDDRELVKWWCKVLDPVLREYALEDGNADADVELKNEPATTAKGYLIVPGFDKHEATSFLPPLTRADPPSRRRWAHEHPLRQLSVTPNALPRCLIPRFPDDPKSRFLDELDDEIPDLTSSQAGESPTKRAGHWKSVKSLEQFWELMAFRQECSSGRLVGFIWIVFTPPGLRQQTEDVGDSQDSLAHWPFATDNPASNEDDSHWRQTATIPSEAHRSNGTKFSLPLSPLPSSPPEPEMELPAPASSRASSNSIHRRKRQLTGPIVPRPPRIKTIASNRRPSAPIPENSTCYYWPPSGRGEVVLDEKQYKRLNELLLRLDFSSQAVAASSTTKWIDEVAAVVGRGHGWGPTVVGRKAASHAQSSLEEPRSLIVISARKRRQSGPTADGATASTAVAHELTKESIRKKPKLGDSEAADTRRSRTMPAEVNFLGSGLVRKKPKLVADTPGGPQS